MMDPRRNWPWRKRSSNPHDGSAAFSWTPHGHEQRESHLGAIISPPDHCNDVPPNGGTSTSFEAFEGVPTSQTKVLPFVSTEISKPSETLITWRKQLAEHELKVLADKLKTVERESVRKDAMVQQHGKVAEEAISGWERAEAEATSLRRELATSIEQIALLEQRLSVSIKERGVLEGRAIEVEESLREYVKQLRQAQEEQQQKIQEAINRETQEWARVKAEMEAVQAELRQRILAAEAGNTAMTKSLQERAKAITQCQQGKATAEMEMGLLQVKLESQATELSAARYELQVLSKELAICKEERDRTRRAEDAGHKQHLQGVKKITQLDAECQRLRSLVRKRVAGPAGAGLAQMRIEATSGVIRSEQAKRRHSLGSVSAVDSRAGHVPSSHRKLEAHAVRQGVINDHFESDMTSRLLVMEEETKVLKETLAKRTCELQSARQLCARTANKLSVAEQQLESLQGTPKSVQSSGQQYIGPLEDFNMTSHHSDERPITAIHLQQLIISGPDSVDVQRTLDDDEVSCAESWASALITELAVFKKSKQSPDEYDAAAGGRIHAQNQALPTVQGTDAATTILPTQALAAGGKDAQLQSVNLMCKDAMTVLAFAETKLGGTWMSENPRSNVEVGIRSVAEANDIMSKLDKMLEGMRIAVASVGISTSPDEDSQNDKSTLSSVGVHVRTTTPVMGADDEHELIRMKQQVESLTKRVAELQSLSDASEAGKAELQRQLSGAEEELRLTKCELSKKQAGELVDLQARLDKLTADEASKRAAGVEQQQQLETAKAEVGRLQTRVAALTQELAEQREKHASECGALARKLEGYVNSKQATVTCRFAETVDARATKEVEMAAAKEKLAECQETILMLGKQLTAFTSPSCASFDSAMSGHYQPSRQYVEPDQVNVGRLIDRHQRRRPPCDSTMQDQAKTNERRNGYSNQGLAWSTTTDMQNGQLRASGRDDAGLLHSNQPCRIHSDLSHRSSIKVSNGREVQCYSVAEHLQMDQEEAISLGTDIISSPCSLSDRRGGAQYRNADEGGARATGGRRTASLAKSLERAAAKSHGGTAAGGGAGGSTGKLVNNGGFSRFFGRSKR